MGWFQSFLHRFNPEAGLVVSAAILADRCFDGVWQRVQLQVLSLSQSELRGYIRARAGSVVRPQVNRFAEETGLAVAVQPRLYDLAMDAVVQRVQTQAHMIASPHAKRRAA